VNPAISAVFVSYRSGPLAARAVASFRAEAARGGRTCETIVVVNSGDAEEARTLSALADRVVVPGANLGYAGGLNAGVAVSRGELLFLANPDLGFLEGSVDALANGAGEAGLVVAGPALFWDDAATLHLPAAEEPSPAELVRRVLALDPARSARVFRREARRALFCERVAREGRTAEVTALSGALMATTRAAFDRVGPFDEAYRLYYEENDWQRRLRSAGGRVLLAGNARVVHRFAQSARREPRSQAWFQESEARYFETHFGERGRKGLERARTAEVPPDPALPAGRRLEWERGREVLVAVSPVASFRPFVLFRPAAGVASFELPPEVAAGHAGTSWFGRAFDEQTLQSVSEARLEAS
jgi:N-acetylglucosaminyl-diphospho-decaprenol L-rhamnosyltransferase